MDDRWWFRTEVVLAALKTEQLLIAGCLDRLNIGLVDASRLIECLSGNPTTLTDSLAVQFRDCRAEMLRQHPELERVTDAHTKDFDAWLAAQKQTFGWWLGFHSRS